MTLNSNEVPASACPACGTVQDAATHKDNEAVAPTEGDFSVCFDCGAICTFGPDLQLQYAAETDMAPATWLECRALQARIHRLNRRR